MYVAIIFTMCAIIFQERPLQQEDCEADYYAGCYAEVGVQPQSPVVEKEWTYDALGDVVGHAHAPVGDESRHHAAQAWGEVVAV